MKSIFNEPSTLISRLRGVYGAGGFTRSFYTENNPVPNINLEAAERIEELESKVSSYRKTLGICSHDCPLPCPDCGCGV